MPYYGSIQVQDRSGWVKTFRLEKALAMVGSAGMNDVILPGEHGGAAPVALQLLHTQPGSSQVRAVNLTAGPLPIAHARQAGAGEIAANASRELLDGDVLQVGEFSLTFSLQSGEGFSRSQRSEHLGLKLELPGLKLRAGRQLDGLLTISNFGAQKRCQFEIDLEGLPADCFRIDPAPLLYPGGEEQLAFRITHRGSRPGAGPCPACLRMAAPGAYPTEEVRLEFTLEVAPVYQVDMRVLDGKEPPSEWGEAAIAPELQAAPAAAAKRGNGSGLPAPEEAARPAAAQPVPAEEAGAASPQASQAPAPQAEPAAPPAAPPQPAEPEPDWWTEAAPARIAPQAGDGYPRRGAARKPRPAPNQPIQVLRTPTPETQPDEKDGAE